MQIQVVHQHGVRSSTAQTKVDLSICLTLCYFKCLLVSLLKVSRTKIFKTFFILSGFGLNVILIVSLFKCSLKHTGKRTEWSLIRSVIIRVISKSWSSDLLNSSMITDRHWTTQSPLTN